MRDFDEGLKALDIEASGRELAVTRNLRVVSMEKGSNGTQNGSCGSRRISDSEQLRRNC
jgi:hypothetical protein